MTSCHRRRVLCLGPGSFLQRCCSRHSHQGYLRLHCLRLDLQRVRRLGRCGQDCLCLRLDRYRALRLGCPHLGYLRLRCLRPGYLQPIPPGELPLPPPAFPFPPPAPPASPDLPSLPFPPRFPSAPPFPPSAPFPLHCPRRRGLHLHRPQSYHRPWPRLPHRGRASSEHGRGQAEPEGEERQRCLLPQQDMSPPTCHDHLMTASNARLRKLQRGEVVERRPARWCAA